MSDTDAPTDSLCRGLCGGDAARFLAVSATGVAELTRKQHELTRDPAITAAEGVVATLLMSAWTKGEERITLQIQSERPPFGFVADADAQGGVRARLTPPFFIRHSQGAVQGLLLAIKANAEHEIYRGVTPLTGQRIDQGLVAHLTQSDQVDVVLRIEATAGKDGALDVVGGVLIERLPAHQGQPSLDPDAFKAQFASIHERPVAELLAELDAGTLAGTPASVLEERPVRWRCSCGQERVEAVLASLGRVELEEMLAEDGGAQVTCDFCNITYTVSADRLQDLIATKS